MKKALSRWLNMAGIVLSIPFLAVSAFLFAWSVVALITGGPDGKIGNKYAILYGIGFLLSSALCGGIFLLLNCKKRMALLTPGFLYDGIFFLHSR